MQQHGSKYFARRPPPPTLGVTRSKFSYFRTWSSGGGGGGGGGGGRGGWYSDIIYIRRLGSFLGVQNIEFQYFGGFQKNYFFGSKILWKCFGVITKLDYILGSFLCILGSFLKVNVQNEGHFLGCLNFKYFFEVLEIPDIFG